MYKSIDEKFKDSSPVETVSNIKQLLNNNGFTVQEDWYPNSVCNCYSLRLMLNDTNLYTCGKGITKELANASAHAELMERLQAGKLGYGKLRFTDAVMMDRQTLSENCDAYFERLANVATKFENQTVTAQQFIDACFDYDGNSSITEAVPFYSVTDDKMVYLPSQMMSLLFTATGNCAGNTAEEAIVQGISEIVERWNQRHFMCMDLVPPTIPDDYLKNYPVAYQTITEIRNAGYDVIVKDCSMETGYPVIATAVIDKKKHAYHVHLGASPVFEIALGRSLTETFQGRMLDTVADTALTESSKSNVATYNESFIRGRGAYSIDFFTENSSFQFIPFPDRTGCSNLQLMQYVVDYIKQRDMKIYIRDMSHLGFHAYKIIVPDMCKSSFDFLLNSLQIPKLVGSTKDVLLDLKNANDDQIFAVQLYNLYYLNNVAFNRDPKFSAMRLPITKNNSIDRILAYIHIGYVHWQYGDKKAAMNCASFIQKYDVPGISDFFSCLLRTQSLLSANPDLSVALEKISIFYTEDTVNEVREILEAGKNPFENYVISCVPGSGSCAACRYREICNIPRNMDIIRIINDRAAEFDNAEAFRKLKALFQRIS